MPNPPRSQATPAAAGRAKKAKGPKKTRSDAQKKRARAAASVSSHEKLANAKYGRSMVEQVVASLLDPDNHPPLRFPGSRKTFVNKLRTVDAFTGAAANAGLQANSGFVIALRDPRCAKIMSERKTSGQGSNYNLIPATQNVNAANYLFTCVAGDYLNIAHADYAGGWARHGKTLMPWVFKDGLKRIWVQSETTSPTALTMASLTPTTPYTFNLSWYLNGQFRQDVINGTSDGAGALNINLPAGRMGYLAIQTVSALAGAQFAISEGSTNVIRHLRLHDLENNLADVDAVRINAVSAMFSDRTAENYSQGDVVSYQASGSQEWPELIGATPTTDEAAALDPYSIAATYNDMHKGSFRKGRYLPLKPSDDPREQQYVQLGETEAAIGPVVFSGLTDYVYVGWNAGILASGTGTTVGEITVVHAIEGVSESQWRYTDICRIPRRVFDDAVFVIAQTDCDFENPNHLAKIWGFIKRALPLALDAADRIAPMLPPQISGPMMVTTKGIRPFLPLLK